MLLDSHGKQIFPQRWLQMTKKGSVYETEKCRVQYNAECEGWIYSGRGFQGILLGIFPITPLLSV